MTDALFEKWLAYEKIVDNDYMNHAHFFETATNAFRRQFSEPLAVLDLGCGDAKPILRVLDELAITRYCGVDESASALARAKIALMSREISCELIAGDLFDTAATLSESFDLIVASYSFHHIAGSAHKERMLRECRRMLSDDGVLVVIDVFKQESESREAYLARWEDNARQNFAALSAAEKDTLIDHVRTSDYPESFSTYQTIGNRAGYRYVDSLAEDGLNRLVALKP